MSVTDPWMSDTPLLLAMGDADQVGGVAHTNVTVVLTQGGDSFELPITDGTLTFDDTRSPRVDTSVTTHLLTDSALLARIDPRLDCRIQIAVGYIRPDGLVDVQPIADLALRSRSRGRPEDTMTLIARSDEALVIDNTVSTSLTVSGANTAAAISSIITTVLPSATVNIDVASTGPAVSQSQLDGEKWQTMMDLADRMGGWQVYDDGLRVWHIADRLNDYDDPAVVLSDGPTGTLTAITEENDREASWANRVKTKYTWTDSGGTQHRVVGVADATGPYAPTTGNVRTVEVTRDVPTTTTEANAAAATLVARTVTRGRVFTLTAPSTYWLRPGHTIVVREIGHDDQQHLVQSVTFAFASGLMTVTTRQPE